MIFLIMSQGKERVVINADDIITIHQGKKKGSVIVLDYDDMTITVDESIDDIIALLTRIDVVKIPANA